MSSTLSPTQSEFTAELSAPKRSGDATVTARPLRDNRPAGAWVSVTKADGTVLAPRPLWAKVLLPPNTN